MPAPVTCSVVIATLDRPASLRVVLRCLTAQTRPASEVVLAVPEGHASLPEAELKAFPFPVRVVTCPAKSSALQRNRGAEAALGDVVAFLDDDIEFGADLLSGVLARFDRPPTGGVGALSPRIANGGSSSAGALTRAYYRLQAGFAASDFGGRLFGPGINCYPSFPPGGPELVRVDWLPATCLFVRTANFARHRFPPFAGYSYAEDVHLTARIAAEAPLYFLRDVSILHHSAPSEFKTDRAALTAGKLHNMAVIAREVLGLRGWRLWWRWQLHRVFLTASLILRRPVGWKHDLTGVWQARP